MLVFFDGSTSRRDSVRRGRPDLIKRGISVLVMDGPGTGERFASAATTCAMTTKSPAALAWITRESDDVDAKRVGVVAISLAGYYAPRMASMSRALPRASRGVRSGLLRDVEEAHRHQLKTSLSVPGPYITWILGVDTLDEH